MEAGEVAINRSELIRVQLQERTLGERTCVGHEDRSLECSHEVTLACSFSSASSAARACFMSVDASTSAVCLFVRRFRSDACITSALPLPALSDLPTLQS